MRSSDSRSNKRNEFPTSAVYVAHLVGGSCVENCDGVVHDICSNEVQQGEAIVGTYTIQASGDVVDANGWWKIHVEVPSQYRYGTFVLSETTLSGGFDLQIHTCEWKVPLGKIGAFVMNRCTEVYVKPRTNITSLIYHVKRANELPVELRSVCKFNEVEGLLQPTWFVPRYSESPIGSVEAVRGMRVADQYVTTSAGLTKVRFKVDEGYSRVIVVSSSQLTSRWGLQGIMFRRPFRMVLLASGTGNDMGVTLLCQCDEEVHTCEIAVTSWRPTTLSDDHGIVTFH